VGETAENRWSAEACVPIRHNGSPELQDSVTDLVTNHTRLCATIWVINRRDPGSLTLEQLRQEGIPVDDVIEYMGRSTALGEVDQPGLKTG
jgi:hypothetical protein